MKRIVVGISGASGSPLALRFLEALRAQGDVEIHLVVSDSALLTASYELPAQQGSADANPFKRFAHIYHEPAAFDASISSGSFEVDAMIIILLLRAADVTIKEKRPLILVARESPLSPIHLKNLSYLSTLPTVSIVPPLLTYYGGQTTVQDMEDHLIGKIFSLLGLSYEPFQRWDPEHD